MHLPTILSALAVTFPRANAASIPRQDPHIVDFRTWGSSDCGDDNQGIWTFTQSDLTGCKSFSSYGVDVRSISLVDIDYANNHTRKHILPIFSRVQPEYLSFITISASLLCKRRLLNGGRQLLLPFPWTVLRSSGWLEILSIGLSRV